MTPIELIIKYIHILAAILFIAIGLAAAWLVDINHPAAFVLIGFLAGDIYRSTKGDKNESK